MRCNRAYQVVTLVMALCCGRAIAEDRVPEYIRLQNGARVLLAPVSDTKQVVVHVIYRVGYIDEPAGMAQAARLLESAVLQSAMGSARPGEVVARLTAEGTVGAETLGTWTHFEYVVPASQLASVLTTERDRMTSLKLDAETLSAQEPEIYSEVKLAEANPRSGMINQAFMAFSKAWSNGAKHVSLKSGLDEIPMEKLDAFRKSTYEPSRLTIAVAGEMDVTDMRILIGDLFHNLPSPDSSTRRVTWADVPRRHEMTWDSDVRGLLVAYSPPESDQDRMLLTLLGEMWGRTFAADQNIRRLAHMVQTPSTAWPVGDLPFYVYATPRDGVTFEQLEKAIQSVIDQELAKPVSSNLVAQFQAGVTRIRSEPICATSFLTRQAAGLARSRQISDEEAMTMILQDLAYKWSLNEAQGLGDVGRSSGMASLGEGFVQGAIDNGFRPDRRFVMTIGPQEKPATRTRDDK